MRRKKIILLSYHFPPDQSAGSTRSFLLLKKFLEQNVPLKIWVLCSYPVRYGFKKTGKEISDLKKLNLNNNFKIVRLWVPYLGQNFFSVSVSYLFYFFQSIVIGFFINPEIIVATSAKLLTGFVGAILSKVTKSLFFLDIRDTFVDNFFYLYRYKKRILLIPLFSFIEKFTLKAAFSVNLISFGFKELFHNIDSIVLDNKKITNFTNGIELNLKNKLQKIRRKKFKEFDPYIIIYAGNIGEGQSIYELINKLNSDVKTINQMRKRKIIFEIYGSGSQIKKIEKLILDSKKDPNNQLNQVVKLGGLIKKDKINSIYKRANCLMLQLSTLKSIECVIPSKIFEYAATELPIIYGARGYTSNFLSQVDGTIPFRQVDSKSFYKSIIKSKNITVSKELRSKFINEYLTDKVYENYVYHILSS